MEIIFIFLFVLLLYLLPTAIAMLRGHLNVFPIFLINLFLGVTGIGWFAALVWSFTSNVEKREQVVNVNLQDASHRKSD